MANSMSPSTYIKSVLHNGAGRYICQLKRMTIKFCKNHGSCNGLREYIEKDLMDFVRENPGVVVYLKPRYISIPSITAEYLNGQTAYESFPRKSRDEIVKWVEYLRMRSGLPIARYIKHQQTYHPSIQGVWTPYVNKPSLLNVTPLPDQSLSEAKTFFPSATEQVLELSKTFGVGDEESTGSDDVAGEDVKSSEMKG